MQNKAILWGTLALAAVGGSILLIGLFILIAVNTGAPDGFFRHATLADVARVLDTAPVPPRAQLVDHHEAAAAGDAVTYVSRTYRTPGNACQAVVAATANTGWSWTTRRPDCNHDGQTSLTDGHATVAVGYHGNQFDYTLGENTAGID